MAYTTTHELNIGGNSYSGAIPLIDKACIGEIGEFKIIIAATAGDVFTNQPIWLNAAHFKNVSFPPYDPSANLQGYYVDLTGLAFATYVMNLVLGANEDANNNTITVTLNYISATSVEIVYKFLMMYDIFDFIKPITQNNLDKFRKNAITASNNFENVISSVYNKDVGQWYWIYIGVPAGAGGGTSSDVEIVESFVSQATVSDFDQASVTVLANTPRSLTSVNVYIDGRYFKVGNGVKTGYCYFSGDGGVTARFYSTIGGAGQIQAGDELFWVGSVAGFELAATMDIQVRFLKA